VRNTRTEYDALRAAVIRRRDGAETFLACGVLRKGVKKDLSLCPFPSLEAAKGVKEEKKARATHPYTHLDPPSLNLQLVYLI